MQYFPTDLFNKFQELISTQCLLRFSPCRVIDLEMQLRERVKTTGISSYEDYFELIKQDSIEFQALIEKITTKKTFFFRLSGQFKALEKKILPEFEEQSFYKMHTLVSSKNASNLRASEPLRIWSAGCATGEEAYSIAMTVMDNLTYPRISNVEILASDISKLALLKAQKGFYEHTATRDIPPAYQEKYLKMGSDGIFMRENITKTIAFRFFNLQNLATNIANNHSFQEPGRGNEQLDLSERFNVIFCRNVMIYFDVPTQQKLINKLFACLKPGGYLFTGDAETLHIYEHNFKTLEFEGTYFYQKPETKA